MSVFSKNPFDLLDDGEPVAPAAAPKAAAKPAPAAAPKVEREVPGSKPSAPRGQYPSRGGPRNVLKETKASPEVNAVDPETGFDGERRAPSRGKPSPRGEGRGRGGPRPARGSRAPGRGGAGAGSDRRYDNNRRSHNAHTDSEKKVNQGWGAEEGSAELAAEIEGAVDATKEEATPVEGAETPAEEPAAEKATPAAAPVEEEEDNTKSYEEYLAEKAQAQLTAGISKLEVRQVEGTSDFVGTALKKSEEAYYEVKKEKAAAEKPKAPKKEKVFIEFEGRFAPPSGGERRGGRGGARGGAGAQRGERSERGERGERGAARGGDRPFRGAGRGGRGGYKKAEPVVQVNDEKAFPALGA